MVKGKGGKEGMKSRGNIYIYEKNMKMEKEKRVILRYRAGWESRKEIQSVFN